MDLAKHDVRRFIWILSHLRLEGFGLLSTLVGTRLSHQILSSVNRTGRRTLGFEQKINGILLYNSLKMLSEFHKNIKDLYFDDLHQLVFAFLNK